MCFDLDGVLINTMPLHAQAWLAALKPRGVPATRRDIYLWEGESGSVSARTLLGRVTPSPTAQAIQDLLQDKQDRFARLARRVPIQPQLRQFLQRAHRRGVPLALVTGTSWEEVQRVVPARLRRVFRAIVTGDRVRHGKPHPEPYLTAMRRLRLDPARTVIVENAPYGIRSARASGGRVLAIASSLPKRYLGEAHEVVATFTALRARLEQLLGI